ncbi:MAG: signal recognition particle-docking protein FtsY [Buchnera aphidicola (Kaburagia rhusicola ensigallis)]
MLKNNKSKLKKFFSWFNPKKKSSKEEDKIDAMDLKGKKVLKKSLLNCNISHKNECMIPSQTQDNLTCIKKIKNHDIKSIVSSINYEKKGIFSILAKKLSKTKKNLGLKIYNLFSKKEIDNSIFNNISEQLLMSDIGLETTNILVNALEKEVYFKNIKNSEIVLSLLKKNMIDILKKVEKPLDIISKKPFSILIVGVNGVGKTSIIGKLTHIFKNEGKSVMLAAGDTFRAAAIDQLKILGKKNSVPVISQQSGADPAAVIFDAFQAAKSKNVDILIADTAGRLHNKVNLMEELKKIKRVLKKLDYSAPDEIILVLDSCIGQNSIKQASIFNKELGITGLAITKLDGTSRGGAIFSIAHRLSIPIRYISFGEKMEDIHHFNSKIFVNAIFSKNI